MKKAIIVSLNFNPGHFSHLYANAKLYKQLGYSSLIYGHKNFNKMAYGKDISVVNDWKDIKKDLNEIDVVVFWFPSLKNIINIIRFKLNYKSKIIYVFHEPFDSLVNYYNAGFNLIKIVKISLINVVNIITVLLSDNVILPSQKSNSIYKKKYTFYNSRNHYIPLIFDDELIGSIDVKDKIYISYIGTIAADHAFEEYFKFIMHCLESSLFLNQIFLIATSSAISKDKLDQLEPYIQEGKVVVSFGSYLSNEHINKYYLKSLVVWNAYGRSMQSGVLAKSFMFGTPILALEKNRNEFIDSFENGIYIKDNTDFMEIQNSITLIFNDIEKFSANARMKFLKVFYFENYKLDFINLS
nr:hypothetical protein [uncultured Flavobacterium sp.]